MAIDMEIFYRVCELIKSAGTAATVPLAPTREKDSHQDPAKLGHRIGHRIVDFVEDYLEPAVDNVVHCAECVIAPMDAANLGVPLGLVYGVGGVAVVACSIETVIEVYNGVKHAMNMHGRRSATLALQLLMFGETSLLPKRGFETTTAYKKRLMSALNSRQIQNPPLGSPIALYSNWILYKYRPKFIQDVGMVLQHFGEGVLALSSVILVIITMAFAGAGSFGIAAASVGILASGIGLGIFIHKSIKHIRSALLFKSLVENGTISKHDAEFMQRIFGKSVRTRLGGLTLGDWFRFKIGNLLSKTPGLEEEDPTKIDHIVQKFVQEELKHQYVSPYTAEKNYYDAVIRATHRNTLGPLRWKLYDPNYLKLQEIKEAEKRHYINYFYNSYWKKYYETYILFAAIYAIWEVIKSNAGKSEIEDALKCTEGEAERTKAFAKLITIAL